MNVEPGQELAPIDQNSPYQIIPLEEMHKLEEAEAAPVDIMSDYWTPQASGESKKVIFQKVAPWKVVDQNTGEVIDLECVFFTTIIDGSFRMLRNGSKKLVAAFQGNNIPPGTGWLITYRGKKRNRTNSFSSDDWELKPLTYNVARTDITEPLHDIDTRDTTNK
jgi:hypothetical protein